MMFWPPGGSITNLEYTDILTLEGDLANTLANSLLFTSSNCIVT